MNVVTVEALEQTVPGLLALKTARSRMEYYFTCTPLLLRWLMNLYTEPTTVIYLDSDLYFFDDPSKVLTAMDDGSIGIIEHRYVPRLERRLGKYGRFNVGWVGFAPDANGRACLDWWGERTLEWCSDTPNAGRLDLRAISAKGFTACAACAGCEGPSRSLLALHPGVGLALDLDFAFENRHCRSCQAHRLVVTVPGDRQVAAAHVHGNR